MTIRCITAPRLCSKLLERRDAHCRRIAEKRTIGQRDSR
jgi:hypothetical protein